MRTARPRKLLAQYGWLAAIAIAYLWVVPYFPRIQSANELPRVYLVKAIVHDGTFAIDRGVARWGGTADVSPHAGHVYSNKAPGSSLLAVPVYAVVSTVAGEPSLGTSLWICRVVSGVLPSLAFLYLLWGFLARFAPDSAVRRLVVIAYALGSMAMTFTLLYYSHQLAAICIASAWILAIDVADGKRTLRAMAGVGFLAGAAPLVDYQAAFAGVPLLAHFVYLMWPRRRELGKALAIAAVFAAIPIGFLLWYHAECFGGPLKTGYDVSQTFAHFHQQGFLGLSKLRGEAFWGSLFSADNGLITLSPWLLLAIGGGVLLWRRSGDSRATTDARALVITCTSIAVIYILFVSAIAMWRGGWGMGPRYITAMLPFMLPLVAAALVAAADRPLLLGALCGTIASGVVIYSLGAATFPYWPDSLKNPLYEVTFRLLGDNAVSPNAGSALGIGGIAGIVPFLVATLGLTGWAIQRATGWRGLAAAVLVGGAIIGAFALVPGTGPHADRAYKNTVYPAVTK
ncbi:MAG: hypothetical protein HOV81_10630 [Kofleriaceae bacterium]|nr:hypothetical protein [Kofleriaceae bacterium]